MVRDLVLNDLWLILEGARWTVYISVVAFVCGGLIGVVVAACRASRIPAVARAAQAYIEVFRGTPLLMQLFIAFYGLPIIGMNPSAWTSIVIAFTFHASAFLGEIWRGAIQSVPRGQSEAALALGLGYVDRMWYAIFPQAIRISLPGTVGFLVTFIKGTSLCTIVGFTELSRAGVIVSNATMQPLLVFGGVAALYFAICWPLSIASASLEKRYLAAG
ncbi:amino acid ABC transporter permease [Shinella sp.]|uniref:amino acid ABC transporter permease n=1 Tax=Shinella sp. TaxID=1870904 RepID=UPI003F6F5199